MKAPLAITALLASVVALGAATAIAAPVDGWAANARTDCGNFFGQR
jgi:hypothetical protein